MAATDAAAVELVVEDLSHDGAGVARHQGKAVFVDGALPGERVRARIRRRTAQVDHAELIEILEASPDRVTPRCRHFGQCSGCALQHLRAEAQIEHKSRRLLSELERIGRVRPRRILPPLSTDAWGYRRKARLSVKYVEKKGRVVIGFRERRDVRKIAELERCEVLEPGVGGALGALARRLDGLPCKRSIAQLELAGGDRSTVLIVRHLAPLEAADRSALIEFAAERGWSLLAQPDARRLEPLGANATALDYALPEFDVRISFQPGDFIQVNGRLNRRLVPLALELLALKPGERVLDLYCGLGNFTLPIARRGGLVEGVEGDPGLVERARANALANGLAAVRYHSADLSLPHEQASWAEDRFDKLLLDPPRTGAETVLRYLPRAKVERVVYVSCHPGTLARDAATLVHRHGFVLEAAGALDMFPHTTHLESVALFVRS